MKRLPSILLLFTFLALGSGALERLHDLQHQAEDARADLMAKAAGIPPLPHEHDDSNCDIHAQLHMAIFVTGWVPLLICLGLLIAFLTLLDTPLIPRLLPARIDCRGPPRLFLSYSSAW